MTAKRTLFWLLLAALVACCLWQTTRFPFDAARLYRAIPERAVLITEHRDLPARWPSLSLHPVLVNALECSGMERREAVATLRSRTIAATIDGLARERLLLAYVPPAARAEVSGWVLSTWIGPTTQYFRSGLMDRRLKGFNKSRPDGRTCLWACPLKGSLKGQVFSLAVFEGVLVGCLSRDPQAALKVRRRLEFDAPVNRVLQSRLGQAAMAPCPTAADRVWFMDGTATGVVVQGAIARFTATGVEGAAVTRWPAQRARTNDLAAIAHGLAPLLGSAPDLFAAGCLDASARALLLGTLPDAAGEVAGLALDGAAADGAAFAALLSGDYSGRVLGVKVPSLVIGLQACDGAGAAGMITNALDRLNAGHDWGLIPLQRDAAGTPVWVVDGIRLGRYSVMPPDEKLAVATWNGWLLLASNARVLCELLERHAAGADSGERAAPAPYPWEPAAAGTAAFAWADSRRACEALANAAAAYELSLLMSTDPTAPARRAGVRKFSENVLRLAPLGHCSLAASASSDRLALDLQVDGQPAP